MTGGARSRVVVVAGVSAVALVAATASMVPAGAQPRHPAPKALVSGQLSVVTVAPHSKVAFAIGSKYSGTKSTTYVGKRNGSHWKKLAVKAPANASFSAIAAGSPSSIWLVGSAFSTTQKALVERSHGGTFALMKTSLPGGLLQGVSASSASNAWVVGTASGGGPILGRWNGHKWSALKVPATIMTDSFNQVSTTGPAVAWILGYSSSGPTVFKANGHTVSTVKLPVPTGASVRGIAASSAKSVWVVGSVSKVVGTSSVSSAFAMHYNGKSWKKYNLSTGYPSSTPSGIAAAGSKAYVAGAGSPKKFSSKGIVQNAFAMTFSGGKWHRNKVTKRGKSSAFAGVAASTKLAVAVGASYNGYLCGAQSAGVVGSPFAASLRGSSWNGEVTPKLRNVAHFRSC